MKLLVLLISIAFQAIVHSAAHAWSPLDGFRSTVESMQHCYWVTASSNVSQEGESEQEVEEEGEEEPDCD